MSELRVKVADHAVARGDAVISTVGLGSCIAIVLYDEAVRVGGLAHILLPSQAMSRQTANPAKFPATAVPLLVTEMRALGARRMTARIIGGASMFGALLPAGGVNMGERNITATRQALAAAGIPTVGEDIGGDHGRSVYFTVGDGRVLVRSLKAGDRVL